MDQRSKNQAPRTWRERWRELLRASGELMGGLGIIYAIVAWAIGQIWMVGASGYGLQMLIPPVLPLAGFIFPLWAAMEYKTLHPVVFFWVIPVVLFLVGSELV